MAKIAHSDVGDTWTPRGTWKVNGTPTDPTQVTVKIRKPDGVITTLGPIAGGASDQGITRESAGVFSTIIALNQVGYWYARFEGTGTAFGAEDHELIVDPSPFVDDSELLSYALVGMAETKDWLQQQSIDTANDMELSRVINDISHRFQMEAGREFKAVGTNPQTRLFSVTENNWNGVVNVGDLAAPPTLIRVLGSDWVTPVKTVAVSATIMLPEIRYPWDPIQKIMFGPQTGTLTPGHRVEITGTFGFPSVPGTVRQAVLDSVAMIMDRDVEHYTQDLGADTSSTEGANVIVLGGRPVILSLPPVAMAVARSYNGPLVA